MKHDIICFAGEDYWYHNPHSNKHIMESLAKSRKVLFVNSIGVRMPDIKSDKQAWKRILAKLASLLRYLRRAKKNLYVLTPIALPFFAGKEAKIRKINKRLLAWQVNWVSKLLRLKPAVYWVCVPTAFEAAEVLKQKNGGSLVYYCVDNIAHFQGGNRDFIAELEGQLHAAADKSIYVNTDLYEERKRTKEHTYLLPHGVDYEHFEQCQTGEAAQIPPELRTLPRPIIGYVGLIRGIDFDLIRFVAERNPNWSFVFVGAVYSDIEAVTDLPNVHFVGRRSYEDLPDYIDAFDCCSLYYRTDNDFDNYRNPKKLMEYFATGKPVVSVANRQMQYFRDCVYVAESYEQFNTYLHQAVANDDPQMRQKRIALAKQQTWDAVADKALSFMNGNQASEAVHV